MIDVSYKGKGKAMPIKIEFENSNFSLSIDGAKYLHKRLGEFLQTIVQQQLSGSEDKSSSPKSETSSDF